MPAEPSRNSSAHHARVGFRSSVSNVVDGLPLSSHRADAARTALGQDFHEARERRFDDDWDDEIRSELVGAIARRSLRCGPVPWARAGWRCSCHIILVPLGVSWAFMTLIANYRGIRQDDHDAMVLAQRWSKYMAVTFAVGAVSGTVRDVRVRLALAAVHGALGRCVRCPVRVRGHLLHRGDLRLDLHLRMAADEAVDASSLASRSCWRASWAAPRSSQRTPG